MASGTETQVLSDVVAPEVAAPEAEGPVQEIDRRSLFRRAARRGGGGRVGGGLVLAGCDFTSAAFDRRIHLLKRLTYGATPADRDRIVAIGETAWLNEQLSPGVARHERGRRQDRRAARALRWRRLDLFTNYPTTPTAKQAGNQLQLAVADPRGREPGAAAGADGRVLVRPLQRPARGPQVSLYKIVEDRDAIRPHALGKFKDLLVASATSPAMLHYLDNYVSKVGAINENYGRELLELHTRRRRQLHRGRRRQHRAAAHRLVDQQHDTGVPVQGGAATTRRRSRSWAGPGPTTRNRFTHGVEFLHWLGDAAGSARSSSARKIARRFVSDRPTRRSSPRWSTPGWPTTAAIGPVLRAMVAHPAFDASAGQKFRRPWDYVSVRAARAAAPRSRRRRTTNQIKQFGKRDRGARPTARSGGRRRTATPTSKARGSTPAGCSPAGTGPATSSAGRSTPITYDTTALRASLNGKTATEIYDLVAPVPHARVGHRRRADAC